MSLFTTQELLWNDEGSFAENASDPGSNTFAQRMAVTNVNLSLEQSREADGTIQSRANESRPGFLMPRTASLEFTCYWYGHNSTAAGALAATQLYTLLKDGLGGGSAAEDGGAVDSATGSGATVTAANVTWLRGGVYRIGNSTETRGAGQAGVVASVAGDVGTFLTLFPGTPDAADVIYGTLLAYPTETLGTTKRFCVGWTATGAQYHLMGAQLEGVTFGLPIGGIPTVTLRYRAAYWTQTTTTVPSGTTMETCNAAPIAGGSIFFQTVGTTTRSVLNPSSISLTLDMPLVDKVGPAAGQAAYQVINGYERLRCVPTLSVVVPWTSDPVGFDTDGSSTTHKHILATLNPTDGRSVGFYMPRAYPTSPKPVVTENNGLLYQTLTYRGREGTDTTNDLTRSVIRFFMG